MGPDSVRMAHEVARRGRSVVRAPLAGLLPRMSLARRETALATLNGLLGDHLELLAHPLAVPMQLRHRGRRLDTGCAGPLIGRASTHVLVLVHGLCQSDRSWHRDGHDPGVSLQRLLGVTPLHACFNSGLSVAQNGDALSRLLEHTLSRWPVPLQAVSIVGHGQGGLVARRAALSTGATTWQHRLRHLVFIGTPHLGLSLDHAGHWLHRVLDLCPQGGPFVRLSALRSAGIVDMIRGHGPEPVAEAGVSGSLPALPADTLSYAIAGTSGSATLRGSLMSDGLVPLSSALGDHADTARSMGIAENRRWIGDGLHHIELMNHPRLLEPLRRWLRQ